MIHIIIFLIKYGLNDHSELHNIMITMTITTFLKQQNFFPTMERQFSRKKINVLLKPVAEVVDCCVNYDQNLAVVAINLWKSDKDGSCQLWMVPYSSSHHEQSTKNSFAQRKGAAKNILVVVGVSRFVHLLFQLISS